MPKEYRKNYPIIYDEVTKYFGNSRAVNQIFLLIEKGECFGIFGNRSVGKSTVLKIALRDKILNYGDIFVHGKSTRKQWKKIKWNCSYVPQYDGLFEQLTGAENIKVLACIRGFSDNRIQRLIEKVGIAFALTAELDNRVSTYSLGNKRKLSMAIAMIGAPRKIFLDEPTTDADPASKHLIWNMIECLRLRGTTIILTSSHIEECKILCTRFTVMANGEFKCMGTMPQLNTKFCKDFTLNMKLVIEKSRKSRVTLRARNISTFRDVDLFDDPDLYLDSAKAMKLVQQNFPNTILKQEFEGALQYTVPKTDVQWSKVFNILLKMQESLEMEEFSLYQINFEDKLTEITAEAEEQEQENKETSATTANEQRISVEEVEEAHSDDNVDSPPNKNMHKE